MGLPSFEIRVKIAVLWILLGFVLTLDYTLQDSLPGSRGLQQMFGSLPQQQLGLLLLGDAFIRVAPFVMAFLTLVLKNRLNVWLNLALGLILTAAGLYGLMGVVSQLTIGTAYELLTQAASIAASALIFLYAYRLRKEILHGVKHGKNEEVFNYQRLNGGRS